MKPSESDTPLSFPSAITRAEGLLDRLGERAADGRTCTPGERTGTEPDVTVDTRPAIARAEETLDRWGERFGVYLSAVSRQVRRFVALAREEGEDILAEAQHLRQNAGQ